MKRILFVLMLVWTMNLSAHAQRSEPATALQDTSTWILSKIGGAKARQHTGNKVFITLDKPDHKVSGYTSCNYIHGKFSMKDTTISFTEIVFGKRVCDESTTALEEELLGMFHKINSWKIEGEQLYLYDKGWLLLEFKSANKK
ncbi:MAG TPA: META domain-containing protein [Cytophagaceae bacterium]|nr:META domain-containing protein [Cytophagaceae bacterium]